MMNAVAFAPALSVMRDAPDETREQRDGRVAATGEIGVRSVVQGAPVGRWPARAHGAAGRVSGSSEGPGRVDGQGMAGPQLRPSRLIASDELPMSDTNGLATDDSAAALC